MTHKEDHLGMTCVSCLEEWPCPAARRLAKIDDVVDHALQTDAGDEE